MTLLKSHRQVIVNGRRMISGKQAAHTYDSIAAPQKTIISSHSFSGRDFERTLGVDSFRQVESFAWITAQPTSRYLLGGLISSCS
mmetsp:Transcript_95175/g.132248  ORF Transcript_95175/g.132248 Transcript_95175/m.132248 type:complete len:85 (+) Transcript_95175:45-299(+)